MPSGQNPISLEYQIHPPTIVTLVTGMTEATSMPPAKIMTIMTMIMMVMVIIMMITMDLVQIHPSNIQDETGGLQRRKHSFPHTKGEKTTFQGVKGGF